MLYEDSHITEELCPDEIHLTNKKTGKVVVFQKNIVNVGRSTECDLSFDKEHRFIARMQATIYCENGKWFLRDNNSTNGTWLNGVKMQPGIKYQLAADDEINFAHSESFIFENTQMKKTVSEGKMVSVKTMEESIILMDTVIDNRYRVLRLIGQGGVSKVYLVNDERSDKKWAMKVYEKQGRLHEQVLLDMVMHEITMLKKLKHPAIPAIIDISENDKFLYVVMEYVEGVALNSLLKESGAQSVEQVFDWAKQLCDVLHYLHTLNPPHIYRDMKPHNIILTPDGTVKLIDFGIMRLYDPKKAGDTICLGTKGYAAPEQFGGMSQTDARTDIFGLGMTMHHLLTGIAPNEPPYECKPIRQVNPKLPKSLERIILKCIERDPQKRYQNCMELRQDLEKMQGKTKLIDKIFKR